MLGRVSPEPRVLAEAIAAPGLAPFLSERGGALTAALVELCGSSGEERVVAG